MNDNLGPVGQERQDRQVGQETQVQHTVPVVKVGQERQQRQVRSLRLQNI